jgi:uncharacterized protein (TIGR02147 family)
MSQVKIVFNFIDYKPYLVHLVGRKGERKGVRSALARTLRCQPTYISQVLNGNLNFNLEQADAIGAFLGHTEEEQHYFLLLIQKARAGTKSLEKYFENQIQNILQRRMVLAERLEKRSSLNKEDQAVYYSSWMFAAIHMALSVPELQSREAISQYLNLPINKVSETLEFLNQCGLVLFENGRYQIGSLRIGKDSQNLRKHHLNWRQRAIESLDYEDLTDLHYSSIFSVSKKDLSKIKDLLISSIEKNADLVKQSGVEEPVALCIDFFSLNRKI